MGTDRDTQSLLWLLSAPIRCPKAARCALTIATRDADILGAALTPTLRV